ncbi:MAG: MarR family winged helix-turn-helix transcriptional regulator [Mycobacteriales bacterium]
MDYAQADALNSAIRTISLRHRARFAAMLAELDLHPGHEAVLFQLDTHGPLTQKQLAAGAECEPPTITLMVRKLEAAGLVSRSPSATDARSVVVELTGEGRRTIPRIRKMWQELAEQTVASLDTTTREQLLAALTDLAAGLRADRDGGRSARIQRRPAR